MKQKTLWIATSNPNKVAEFKTLLPDVEIKSLLDLETPLEIKETGLTFAENALMKAKVLATFLHQPAIGEDSGLIVDALDGFPGIYSARWALPVIDPEEINEKLLEKLGTEPNREAAMETVIAYYNPATEQTKYFFGAIKGTITMKPRGVKVFGYDQIFQPEGSSKTFSELGDEKNQFSHRQQAIQKFKEFYQGSEVSEPEN